MNHFPVVGRPKWPVVTLVYVCSRPLCPSQPPRPFCWPTNIRCFSWFFLFQKKSYYIKLKRFTGPGVRWCNSFECQDDFSVSACCFTSNDVGGKGAESRSDGPVICGGGPSTCLLLWLLRWLSAVSLVFSTKIPRLHKSLSNSGGHRSRGSSSI